MLFQELNGFNSTQKVSSYKEDCPNSYKCYLVHIIKQCGIPIYLSTPKIKHLKHKICMTEYL